MSKETKKILGFIAFGVVLYAALMNLPATVALFKGLVALTLPVVIGLVLAFVINVPMTAFQKLFSRIRTKKPGTSNKALYGISLSATFVCLLLIVFLVFTLLIPELASSAKSVYKSVEAQVPHIIAYLNSLEWDMHSLTEWLENFDLKSIVEKAIGGMGNVVDSIVGITTSTFSYMFNGLFGFIIAIYVLMGKDDLGRQGKKLVYAYLKKPIADKVCYVCRLISDTYTKFLSGQCVEAVILGGLIFLSLAVFRLPYAGLIGVLTGVFSFIPYVGAFLSCFIGAVLIALIAPSKVILFIIVFQVAQFIENQFIYPHVVGNSVGLSALWTVVAVLVGGNFFGLLGMIFFIPLTAVIYTLLADNVNNQLKNKNIEITK